MPDQQVGQVTIWKRPPRRTRRRRRAGFLYAISRRWSLRTMGREKVWAGRRREAIKRVPSTTTALPGSLASKASGRAISRYSTAITTRPKT